MTWLNSLSDNARGAVLMMCSMAAFTLNDLFIKAIGTSVPLSQLLWLRGLLASALIFLLARYLDALHWPKGRKDLGLILLRSIAEVAAAYFFLTALLHMYFANVTAVLQTLPLTVTLGAALIFRERVGWRRGLAILLGFCGMLLIVKPGTDGFTIHTIYTLCAVLCVTVRDLAARKISKDVPSLTVTLFGAVIVTLGAALASIGSEWAPMSASEWSLLTLSAGAVIGGYVFSVMVMRVGDVSFVAPFRYTALLWALLLGYVFFGEWPDIWTIVGAAVIVATGVFTLYRERRARRRMAT